MKRIFICLCLALSALGVQAQTTELTPSKAVAVRTGGDFTFVDVSFKEFSNKIFPGGGGWLSASYEQPIAPKCIMGFGVGGSFESTRGNDQSYYYKRLSLGSIYGQVYYGFRYNHLFANLGMQLGYVPPVLTRISSGTARMTTYQYRPVNGWAFAQIGYTTGRWDVGVNFRIAMMSEFKEAYTFPIIDGYRTVRSRWLSVGITAGYRFELPSRK